MEIIQHLPSSLKLPPKKSIRNTNNAQKGLSVDKDFDSILSDKNDKVYFRGHNQNILGVSCV